MPGLRRPPHLLDEHLTFDPSLAPLPDLSTDIPATDLAPVPSPDAAPPASATPTLDLFHIDPAILQDEGEPNLDLHLDVPEYRPGLSLPFLEGTPLEGIGHDVETWSQDPMAYTRDQDTEVNRQRADFDESVRLRTEAADRATGNPEAWEVTGGSVPVLSF